MLFYLSYLPRFQSLPTTHLAQPNSLYKPLSPSFYFPVQTTVCCWIKLPRTRPQSYPMLKYSHTAQYTLPHNQIMYYHSPRVTWNHTIILYTIIIHYMSHSPCYHSMLSYISDITWYTLPHGHLPYYHISHFT